MAANTPQITTDGDALRPVLSRAWLTLPLGLLTDADRASLQKSLTLVPKKFGGPRTRASPEDTITAYQIRDGKIRIPRFFPHGLSLPAAKRAMSAHYAQPMTVPFAGKVRPEQEPSLQAMVDSLEASQGSILSVRCGGGKTVQALWLIAHLKLKALVVVPKEFLLQQWRERISEFLPGARVGIIQQNRCEVDDVDIALGIINTLACRDFPPKTFWSFGVCVVDECHKTATQMFSQALPKVASLYNIGLTATPKRSDGMERLFHYFLGPMGYRNADDDHKVCVEWLLFDSPDYKPVVMFDGTPSIASMINQISASEARNQRVIARLREFRAAGRKILILGDRIAHARRIQTLAAALPLTTAGLYIGGMKAEALKLSESCDIIVASYKMASEGLDIKGLNTLVLMTPRVDIEQSVGRILRDKHPEKPLVILDVVDYAFSVFPNQAAKRLRYYNSKHYDCCVMRTGHSPDEIVAAGVMLSAHRHYRPVARPDDIQYVWTTRRLKAKPVAATDDLDLTDFFSTE